MFSCVWLYFKKCFEKYFIVFGCVLENIIKNIFSIYCSYFLGCQTNIYHSFLNIETQTKSRKKLSNSVAFSRLPNKYIISFIPQYRNTNKTQKKKISNPVKLREEGREREVTRFDEGLRSAQRRDRDQHGAHL